MENKNTEQIEARIDDIDSDIQHISVVVNTLKSIPEYETTKFLLREALATLETDREFLESIKQDEEQALMCVRGW